jgi:hypothetical protein
MPHKLVYGLAELAHDVGCVAIGSDAKRIRALLFQQRANLSKLLGNLLVRGGK